MEGYAKVKVTTSDGKAWWIGESGRGDKLHLIPATSRNGQTACGGQRSFGAAPVLLPESITADEVSARMCARCYAKIEAAINRHATLTMTKHA